MTRWKWVRVIIYQLAEMSAVAHVYFNKSTMATNDVVFWCALAVLFAICQTDVFVVAIVEMKERENYDRPRT